MNLKLLILVFIGFTYGVYGQVGIGTVAPNESSQLDIVAADKGVLIPRVQLSSVQDVTTIANGNEQSLLVFNTTDNNLIKPGYYYWFQNNWKRIISSGDQEINLEETLTWLQYDEITKTLIFSDETGALTEIDLELIFEDLETTSTLVANGDGTYTYTNESDEVTIVDIPSDIITNIQNQGAVYTEIVNMLNTNTDLFVDNGDGTFTHTSVDGTAVTFNANTTTMLDNGDGTYTFTNSNGDTITVDVIGDVVTNIQNQGAVYTEITNIYGNPLKSFLRYGGTTGFSILSLNLLNGYNAVKFPDAGKAFDENDEYDETTASFTAKQDGIYDIFVQADSKGLISASEFGVGIFKIDGTTNVTSLVAEERFLSVNVSVLLINLDVSPPTRSTQTLVKLKAGDKIIFGVKVPLLTLNLAGSTQTYFTIHQVK